MKIETIGIVVTYMVMLIINFAFSKLFDFLPDKGINIPFAIYGTVMEIGILLPAIIYTKMKGESLIDSFGFRKIRPKTVLLTVGLTLLSLPPFWSANVLSQVFVPNTAVEAASEMTSGSLLVLLAVSIIFLPLIKRVLRKIAVSENKPEAMTNLS